MPELDLGRRRGYLMKMMKSTTGMQRMEHKKTAVITGASSGLGAAMAAEFRRNGFHVVALCRKAPAQGLADEFIAADLTDPEELRAAAGRASSLRKLFQSMPRSSTRRLP